MRLPREAYLKLKEFKNEVNKERADKIFRDHAGHLYRTDEHGTIRRLSGDELSSRIADSLNREHMLGKVEHTISK